MHFSWFPWKNLPADSRLEQLILQLVLFFFRLSFLGTELKMKMLNNPAHDVRNRKSRHDRKNNDGVEETVVQHPELFAGLVAIAGMPCLDCLDLSPIAEVPLLYLFGSEDLGGQDFMLYAVRTLKRHLKRFSYKVSGGAVHGFEWQPYTRQIFDWIDSVAASEDGRASGHTH